MAAELVHQAWHCSTLTSPARAESHGAESPAGGGDGDGAVGGEQGDGGGEARFFGGDGGASLSPQSAQSCPKLQREYSAPGPPSSHMASFCKAHTLRQDELAGDAGGNEEPAATVQACRHSSASELVWAVGGGAQMPVPPVEVGVKTAPAVEHERQSDDVVGASLNPHAAQSA